MAPMVHPPVVTFFFLVTLLPVTPVNFTVLNGCREVVFWTSYHWHEAFSELFESKFVDQLLFAGHSGEMVESNSFWQA